MSGSLRDQLVKAGLASAEQARKAERQARAEQHAKKAGSGDDKNAQPGKKRKKGGHKAPASPTERARARAKELNAEKTKRNLVYSSRENEKARQRALRAEMRQLIFANDQRAAATTDDDVPYNFVHGKKVKRIYVPPAQRDQLSKGSLVIVNNDGRYHLVSPEVAEKVRAKDPKRIIAAHDYTSGGDDEDDFYAAFKVPDDLDW